MLKLTTDKHEALRGLSATASGVTSYGAMGHVPPPLELVL